ncbi:MAG: 4-(cytidine 5'-diphospho)-2-C-methyl-D-erythritol kinase, partial [Candidatus Adiutrix sp.]|nr:4-(cytidine 5'-diphospho)-2-C-methyl-D-erythritol kinase [Candidatus Adiutrix sp.]
AGKRPDGYHELDAVMAKLELADRLRLEIGDGKGDDRLTAAGDPPGGFPTDFCGPENLALRAVRKFRAMTGWPQGAARIFLTKNIPLGAGLGGGSSDGAAVLTALNSLAPRPLPVGGLLAAGLALGADVPFFIDHRNMARARGVGEKLAEPPPEYAAFSGRRILLLNPGFQLSTGRVFQNLGLTNKPPGNNLGPLSGPPAPGENDLLAPALRLNPRLAEMSALAADSGLTGGMSGSGPTFWLYGPESAAIRAILAAERRGWRLWKTSIL